MCNNMPSLIFFLSTICLPTVWLMDQKALDEFVKVPDSHYSYTFLKRHFLPASLITVNFDDIKLTSQKWLDESEVDKTVWTHNLTIVVPKTQSFRKSCLLILTNDDSNKSFKGKLLYNGEIYLSAIKLQSTIAILKPLPMQPLTFYDHPLGLKNITGYDIIAYSWWKFINDPKSPPYWLAQFPMVKATVRAMDAIVAYMKKIYGREITHFTLTGISMGAWISWLTAAVDKRVEAIIPIGMDFLDFTETFQHQYRAYCGWSYKLRPFYVLNITRELYNPRFMELVSHTDPLAYNERYKNTAKFIIVFSGDELFQPDNTRYYFSQLEGVKYLRIIPNADYGTEDQSLIVDNMRVFYLIVAEKREKMYGLPMISWKIEMTNTSEIITVRAPNANRAYSYHADTVDSTRRDFRMRIAAGNSSRKRPVKWIQTDVWRLKPEADIFKAEIQKPKKGWRAFFIEVRYPDTAISVPFKATSEMRIMPDIFPCPFWHITLV